MTRANRAVGPVTRASRAADPVTRANRAVDPVVDPADRGDGMAGRTVSMGMPGRMGFPLAYKNLLSAISYAAGENLHIRWAGCSENRINTDSITRGNFAVRGTVPQARGSA